MSMAVHTVLSDLRRRQNGAGEGLVFCKGNGAAWGAITTAFTVALKRAKITAFRFHDLRHTCASWLVMDGATLMEVREILGHQTLSMSLRYAHLSPGRLREAVARLDRVFNGDSTAIANSAALASVNP